MAEIFTEKAIQNKTKILLTFDNHGDVLRLDIAFHHACVEAFVCTTEGGKLNDNLSQTLAYYGSDAEIFRVKASLGTPIRSHVDHGLAVPLDVEVGPVVVIGHCAADLFTSLPNLTTCILYSDFYKQLIQILQRRHQHF